MRTPFIAGNWKMNLNSVEARDLAQQLNTGSLEIEGVDIAVAPTATSLVAVLQVLADSKIEVAAQNIHWESSGAYTGEISAEMIKELGCSMVIIGHSERRQYFGETNETVNKRLHAALKSGLKPIVCVGETIEQREAGKTMDVVGSQLNEGLAGVSDEQMKHVTIAYEPVWAIGTGKTATTEQAQEVHAFLRGLLKEIFNEQVAQNVRIQYGGSVKPSNAKELLEQEDIDGALVGGASLTADSFLGILKFKQ
jgi:triosephosphate isomerase